MSSGGSTGDAGVEDNQNPPPALVPQENDANPTEESLLGIGIITDSVSFSGGVTGVHEASTSDCGPESSASLLLLSSPKRRREDDIDTNAEPAAVVVADFAYKRQKADNNDGNAMSMIEKLKIETKQLIENPDETLGPDLVPPSEQGIHTFHDNDVLSGRGGGTNVHPGNRNFRDLINIHRRLYLKARKNDKPTISRAIVRSIRNNDGRFLKKDDKSGLWFEIGDDAAREKTSQALRQRAPEMRKILFDTERDEARAEQLRSQPHRMMMGIGPPNAVGTVLPTMASIAPAAIHPGMMAYAAGAIAPMMFVNPAMFMQTPQQLQQPQQQPGAKPAAGGVTAVQPAMQPMMMMDQYQQAAMFQFMTNPMMMAPLMQFQSPAQQPPQLAANPTQPTNGGVSNDHSVPTSQAENPLNESPNDTSNTELQGLQEANRDLCGSETNSVFGE